MIAHALVHTPKASRYLQALCGHFSHKTTVDNDAARGHVTFPFGTCELRADATTLTLRVEADDAEAMTRAKEVVGGHLERFAVKDDLRVAWQEGAAAS